MLICGRRLRCSWGAIVCWGVTILYGLTLWWTWQVSLLHSVIVFPIDLELRVDYALARMHWVILMYVLTLGWLHIVINRMFPRVNYPMVQMLDLPTVITHNWFVLLLLVDYCKLALTGTYPLIYLLMWCLFVKLQNRPGLYFPLIYYFIVATPTYIDYYALDMYQL